MSPAEKGSNGILIPEDTPVDLRADGVLWAINRTLFHPRGFALGYDQEKKSFMLKGDGTEPWQYASPIDEDDLFKRFETLLDRARGGPA